MVLTPQQVKEKSDGSQQLWRRDVLNGLEVEIDKQLKVEGSTISLGESNFYLHQRNPDIFEELKQIYNRAGWEVKYRTVPALNEGQDEFYIELIPSEKSL
ncbi:hypothetical protein J4474_04745 [Candidatus Pacearchaeota archaeon]|nr:hypothetical protein [Candidatus Pacearchaeota archaeon]